MARSLVACSKGIKSAESALIGKGWSREVLAGKVTVENSRGQKAVSKQTIDKFFAGKTVDRLYFVGICNTLKLDWEVISGVKKAPIEVAPSESLDNSDGLQSIIQPYLNFVLNEQNDSYIPTDAIQQEQRILGKQGEGQAEAKEEQIPQPVMKELRKYALGDRREHVILSGRPGSGKSKALQQLRLTLAAEGLVPVLVQLKGDRSVPEMIQREFRRAKQQVSLDQIDDWLLADRLVVLLDGVNEIPTDDLRRGLAEFREQNATVPMIFTTRDLAIGGDFGIKQRLEMKPLTDLQMRKFIAKRLPVDGEKLLGQLGDRLREIAETPLLLKMLCDVFGETKQIPENKGELFRWFDQEYDKFKGLPPVSEDFRRFKSEILQQLAFVMMTGDSSKPTEFWLTIDRGVAEKEIEKILIDRVSEPAAKAKEWLEDLLEHHLLQVAAETNQVEFHHQLFQEYYAAVNLLGMFHDGHPDVTERHRFQHFYLNYLKWTEIVLLLLSLRLDNAITEEILISASEVDPVLGIKFRGCLKKNKTVGSDKSSLEIDISVLFKSVTSHDRCTVKSAISDLSSLGDAAIPALIEALKNGDPMNFMAAEALGGTSTEIVIPMLLLAINDEDDFVREGAARALGNLDGIREWDFSMGRFDRHITKHPLNNTTSKLAIDSKNALQKCLNDDDNGVRSAAVIALGKIGCNASESRLYKMLVEEFHSSARKSAAVGLIMLGLDNLIPALSNLRTDNYHTLENAKDYFYSTARNAILQIRIDKGIVSNEELEAEITELIKKVFVSGMFANKEADCLREIVYSLLGNTDIFLPLHYRQQITSGIYNYEIYCSPPMPLPTNQKTPQIINAKEVKIFENVNKYYENSQDNT